MKKYRIKINDRKIKIEAQANPYHKYAQVFQSVHVFCSIYYKALPILNTTSEQGNGVTIYLKCFTIHFKCCTIFVMIL